MYRGLRPMSIRPRSHLLVLLTYAACGGGPEGGPHTEVADSAGVRVVVNGWPDVEGIPTWEVAAGPEVEVGTLEGAPEYQLFQVSGATVLPDGTLVIANRGTHDLRFFDAQGGFLCSAGSQGDGPGEFQSLELVGRFGGDSLLTFDFQQRRASVFGRDCAFVRSFRIGEGPDMRSPRPAGVLSSGVIVVRQGAIYMAGEATTGADRTPVRLFLAGPGGAVNDSLGAFPGAESFVLAEERMMLARPLTFGRGLSVSVAGETVAVGNNDAFSVRVYDADGSLLHVVRQRRDPISVEAEDFARQRESLLAEIEDPGWRRRTEEMLEQMPRHETFPAYASIEVDQTGRLWIEEYRRPGDEQPVWQVFDQEGVLVARVRTPVGLRILDIGRDYVLGVARDDLDVERVRLYRLEKP